MESKRDIILVITHTLALGTGIFCGYYLNNKFNQNKASNSIKNSDIYCCDVFDNKGNPKITNYFIDEDTFNIHFEEEQNDISFIITRGGNEVANVDKFTGKEYKFIK